MSGNQNRIAGAPLRSSSLGTPMWKFEDDGQGEWGSAVVPASTVHYFGGE